MNISCSKFPQKLYNYNLHSIVLPLTHFLTVKKKIDPYSLYINVIGANQSATMI